MQQAKIIEQPHLLFIGANGHKTFGITVETIGSYEDVEKKGLSRKWYVNDREIRNPKYQEFLGISFQEYQNLLDEFTKLEKENKI